MYMECDSIYKMKMHIFLKKSVTVCFHREVHCWFLWITVILNTCLSVASFSGFPRKMLIPRFLPTPTNVTYEKGEVATLFCSVSNIGTKTITWRKQPYHVPLFIGSQRFVRIDRFYLSHIPNRGEWNLLIKNVQPFDSGIYECQVSASQELRRNITLNVMDKLSESSPFIEILGTRFVEKGGMIKLQCNASGSQSPHGHIDWFKDVSEDCLISCPRTQLYTHRITAPNSPDNGNLLLNRTKIGNHISITTHSILSMLTISHAQMSDAGTYVCRTSDLLTTRFRVDVLKAGTKNVKREYGEFSDGTAHSSTCTSHNCTSLLPLTLMCSVVSTLATFLRLHNR